MRLGLLPHRGESLTSLSLAGQADRLIRYYFSAYNVAFSYVSYFSYAREEWQLPQNCVIHPNRTGARGFVYGFLMPVVWYRAMRACAVLRVYQLPGIIPALLAKLLHRTPVVVTYGYDYAGFAERQGRTLEKLFVRICERLAFAWADRFIVTTETMREYVARRAGRKRVHLIPNGVDTSLFAPRRRTAEESTLTPRVVCVAALLPRKRIHVLIDAVSRCQPRPEVMCIGTGPERRALEELARARDVKLTILEGVIHQNVAEILCGADVFALLSEAEGHPKALLEAMSCGLPVIVSRESAGEVVKHNCNGIVCEADADSVGIALQRLLDEPDTRVSMGSAARELVVTSFRLETLIQAEIQLLRQVADRVEPDAA